ncbi:MAG: acyltransferase [Lachnospiraceae bacterium]
MESSYYSEDELKSIGFKKIGTNVRISRKVSIYGTENMILGNNIRIDDFCVLSGRIILGNHIHIAVYSCIFGGNEGVWIEDFAGVSSRCAIYAISDDYTGEYMTNPTVSEKYTNIIDKKVRIGRHVDIGTGSTILPGVEIGEGCSFGAMTLVTQSTKPWGFYMGYQCIRVKERSKKLLELERKLLREEANDKK